MNETIKESQAGFRKRRSTRNHIFVLNLIGNKIKKRGKIVRGIYRLQESVRHGGWGLDDREFKRGMSQRKTVKTD